MGACALHHLNQNMVSTRSNSTRGALRHSRQSAINIGVRGMLLLPSHFVETLGAPRQSAEHVRRTDYALSRAGYDTGRTHRHCLRFRVAIIQALLAMILGLCSFGIAGAPVNVTTQHNDIGRTGQNLDETILTTANVNPTQFGKLFAQFVDGQIYAQPLYLSGITINGAVHNVVFVTTEHDSVYAFDADANTGVNATPLWQASMLSGTHGAAPGATTVPWTAGSDIYPEIGITGTPVIDPASNTLYVVSASIEGGTQIQRLHALDVTTGAEKFGGPVIVAANVTGIGVDSVAGTVSFNAQQENQRAGLLLLNGIVYIGFSSHEDHSPWHGWIVSYSAGTLQQTGVFCTSPNGNEGGIWMAGNGLAADQLDPVNHPYGRLFVPTGNGDYTAVTPYSNAMDYGDSVLDLDLTNGALTITDEFTTNAQAALDATDSDTGSGGVMILPAQSTGANPHLLVQAGKSGVLFLLDRDSLGGYNTTADQAVQEQINAVGGPGVWSSPAYWNGNVYYWGQYDHLKSFPVTNGLLSTTPTRSTEQYSFPGATPSISANGSTQGIVWTVDSSAYVTAGPANLQAHDANNVATTLYSSTTNTARDSAGPAVKFAVPTIANGKVYVGTANQIDVYGLLNGMTQTSVPIISPGSESFAGSAIVTITDATPNATIYYTIDGTAATTASTPYSGSILVNTSEAVHAIGYANGALTSAQASATYTSVYQATSVVFSLPTGIYTSAQTVNLSDVTASATIYYTTDGSTPTTASTIYTGPIAVNATETITAMAVAAGITPSPVIAQTYTIEFGQSGISFGSGFSGSTSQLDLHGSTVLGAYLQLTSSSFLGSAASAWYQSPINVQTFTTDFTFQLLNALGEGFTFAIQRAGANAIGGYGYNLGYGGIGSSVAVKFDLFSDAGEGPDSTGLYVNGATPTVPAIDLSSTGINLHSGDTMAVHLAYNGTALSLTITDLVTGANWSTSWTINIPATIGGNTAYVGFTAGTGQVSATQNILSWTYYAGSATPTAATPSFSPGTGTYASAQSVTVSDATSGATIYYTTNGSTPTTASAVYSGPITVSATETLQAIAIASGYSTSAVGSAAYTIGSTAPVVNDPTGFTAAGFNFVGATLVGSALQLTNGGSYEGRAVWYATPVNVQTFTTDFTFQLVNAQADGFTFAMQNAGVNALGSGGGALGYQGIGSSVAVKFDLYNNSGEGTDSTGFYTDGAAPTVPSVDMSTSGINLHSGDILHAHITYDGTTLSLTITDTVTGASFTTSTVINIPATVGANTAYVGFTAGTGGLTATQNILNWTYLVN